MKQKVYKECDATGDGCLEKELEAGGIQSWKNEKVDVASGDMSGLIFKTKRVLLVQCFETFCL